MEYDAGFAPSGYWALSGTPPINATSCTAQPSNTELIALYTYAIVE
jgi:hypothetical protein